MRKEIFIGLKLALAASLCLAGHLWAGSDEESTFPRIERRFGSKTISQSISNSMIDYGGLQVLFIEGELHRRPSNDVGYDYFFLGRGEIVVGDATPRDNLWSHWFDDRVRIPFTSAYLCGRHLPLTLGLSEAAWGKDRLDRRNHHRLTFMIRAVDKYFGLDLEGEMGLWPESEGTLLPVWADFSVENERQLVVHATPDDEDPVQLFVYDEIGGEPFYVGSYPHPDSPAPVRIDSTIIDIELMESGKFEASCRLVFAPGTDTRGLELSLPHLYTVDSVIDATGRRIGFIKKRFRRHLYLAPRRKAEGQDDLITIYYRGKFIAARQAGYDLPANLTTWFPQLAGRHLGRFITHYTLHKDMELLSVGTRIDETVNGRRKTITYRSNGDISYISFAFGKYDLIGDSVRGVPITLYIDRQTNQGIFNRGIPRRVLAEMTEAFGTFYDWFGKPSVQELRIVDRPFYAGQSSPGLIHLPSSTFFESRGQARLRAHEMAHQWWGHTVVPRSHREIWLSEGLAEYSAYLFLDKVENDRQECREILDAWRRHVLQEGIIGNMYSRGYRAGPITAGVRLLQSYSPGDYLALVYSKAASVLRMLHFEIDGPDFRTDFFLTMLAEYRRRYAGGQAGNDDFMACASRWIGEKRAGQFFEQWLADWRLPDIVCHYQVTPDRKGRDLFTCQIEVSGVSDSFSTPYPIEIELADGSRRLYRVDGIGQIKDFELGPFPEKIAAVRFDPGDIILCASKKVIEP